MKIKQKNIKTNLSINPKFLKIFIFSIFLLNLLSFSTRSVQAQTEINLTVSPPISYLQVPPGTNRTHTVVLENSGDTTITVMPSIVDFSSDGKTGRAILSNELSFPYISFGVDDIEELSIPAHKKAQLTLYINIPNDAVEKEYPLTILFFSKNSAGFGEINPSTIKSTHSQITGAIGSNLVVLVSKETNLNKILRVLDLGTPKIVDSFGKIKLSPLVENTSLASFSASGSAEILNWKKNTVAEFELFPDIILGNTTRELRALREGIEPNKPETGTFSYKPKFLLGPYQVIINLENDQQGSSQYIEVIYAFPLSIIVITIVGLIIGFIYFKKIKTL